MTSAAELGFFDGNAIIGKTAVPALESWLSPEDMLAEMDRYAVREALVSHAWAREIEPAVGNTALRAAVAAARKSRMPEWTSTVAAARARTAARWCASPTPPAAGARR